MECDYVEIGTDGDESSSSNSISNLSDKNSENRSHQLNQIYKDHDSSNETLTSSIYKIGLAFDYKEEVANKQQKKLSMIDLLRYHVLTEENQNATIIHGTDRQFYTFVRNGYNRKKVNPPVKWIHLDYYETLMVSKKLSLIYLQNK